MSKYENVTAEEIYPRMNDLKIAMMTTKDPENRLVSRPMMACHLDKENDRFLFFAHKQSAKIQDI